jgi:hypothetical protein
MKTIWGIIVALILCIGIDTYDRTHTPIVIEHISASQQCTPGTLQMRITELTEHPTALRMPLKKGRKS